jgi:hypothetical protein
VTASTIVDDVANRPLLGRVLAMAGEGELSLDWLRELACGKASTVDRARFAEDWTASLVDYLQRGGVGQLTRCGDGRIVFRFAQPVPTVAEIERRVLETSSLE